MEISLQSGVDFTAKRNRCHKVEITNITVIYALDPTEAHFA